MNYRTLSDGVYPPTNPVATPRSAQHGNGIHLCVWRFPSSHFQPRCIPSRACEIWTPIRRVIWTLAWSALRSATNYTGHLWIRDRWWKTCSTCVWRPSTRISAQIQEKIYRAIKNLRCKWERARLMDTHSQRVLECGGSEASLNVVSRRKSSTCLCDRVALQTSDFMMQANSGVSPGIIKRWCLMVADGIHSTVGKNASVISVVRAISDTCNILYAQYPVHAISHLCNILSLQNPVHAIPYSYSNVSILYYIPYL